MSTWIATWRLMRLYPRLSIFSIIVFFLVGIFPIIVAQLMKMVFDTLSSQSAAASSLWTLIALLLVAGISGRAIEYGSYLLYFQFGFFLSTLMRRNLLGQIMELPGAQALIATPGELISRFSGDVEQVASLAQDMVATNVRSFVLVAVSIPIMFTIEPRVTLIAFLPLAASVALVNMLKKRMQKYRLQARQTQGEVTSFIGQIFEAVQAIKVAKAESFIEAQFGHINEERRKASVKDTLFTDAWYASLQNTKNVGIGIMLIVIGQAMAAEQFTVGDFALFMSLMIPTAEALNYLGNVFGRHKLISVSLNRLTDMLQSKKPENLLTSGPVYLHKKEGWPAVPHIQKSDDHYLDHLKVDDLTYLYPHSGRGIEAINLSIPRGSFVVITGRIGAGKTTLLRAILGLLPATGQIYWNGKMVTEPSNFFIPPRTAYTPQVSHLFSDTLSENILLGLSENQVQINDALYAAVLEKDLERLDAGLDTLIGTRGVRLSGGQIQRTAAARMFIRKPELFVFDDLSSALDVETEKLLWERLLSNDEENGITCLAVSHRHAALQKADHIILLSDGRITDEGSLAELLDRSKEIQAIWDQGIVADG